MDQNTNPFVKTNPVVGTNSSVPPSEASLQGGIQNMQAAAGAVASPVVSPSQMQAGGVVVAPAGAVSPMVASVANPVQSAPVNLAQDMPVGFAQGVPMSPTQGMTADSTSMGGQIGANANIVGSEAVGTMPTFGMNANPVATAPMGAPTNIGGINSVRTPDVAASTVSDAAAINPFASSGAFQTPNAPFADLATEQQPATIGSSATVQDPNSSEKKPSRTVLIVLSVVAFLIAIALAVVLVMEVMGIGPFAANNNGNSGRASGSVVNIDNNGGDSNDDDGNENNSDINGLGNDSGVDEGSGDAMEGL